MPAVSPSRPPAPRRPLPTIISSLATLPTEPIRLPVSLPCWKPIRTSRLRIACRAISPCSPSSKPIVPVAVEAARTAQSLAAGATPRERSHIAALTAWAEGELDRAIALWESILRTHPHDVVAFRLAHFVNFWLGRPQDMVASVERVIPAWSEDIPGYRNRSSPATASPTRRPETISAPSHPDAARSSSTPAISGPRTPSPM